MFHLLPLGAQKSETDSTSEPGIRFGVYAPNARQVEVVFGFLWKQGDPDRTPVGRLNPAPYCDLLGGYIADDGSGIDPSRPVIPLVREENGCWFSESDHPDLRRFLDWDHVPYMFRITKSNGAIAYRSDLYSRCQIGAGHFDPCGEPYDGPASKLSGTKSCSVVVDSDTVTACFDETMLINGEPVSLFPETRFISQEEFWRDEFTEGKTLPKRLEDCVIYQLHIPALGFGRSGVGSVADAIGHLDHLEELGVNAIELLPVSEYGNAPETWGYSTSHHHAIEFSGGGRDKMKYFIREAHRRGIAVIFDVVYNHYAHDAERAQWMYDSDDHEKNTYYWYHGHPLEYADRNDDSRHFPGSGGYLCNMSTGFTPSYHDSLVRHLFISSAVTLLREFHVDGFRVDQTTSIHRYNVLNVDGSPRPDANRWGKEFLQEWCEAVLEAKADVLLTAEDHSNEPFVTRPVSEGGLGFQASWYADFHHHLCGTDCGSDYAKLIPTAGRGGDGPLAMNYFAGALSASSPEKIVYHVSHDEAGNAGRGSDDPDRKSHRTMRLAVHDCLNDSTRSFAEARSRVALGVTLFSAGVPLFLFGEELAFENDFLYDDVLSLREDFDRRKEGTARNMFDFYHDAIHLRLSESVLRRGNLEIVHVHNDNRILAWRRWDESGEFLIVASLNNHPFEQGYVFEHSALHAGTWRKMLDGDSLRYGGRGRVNEDSLESESGKVELLVPENTVIVLKKTQ